MVETRGNASSHRRGSIQPSQTSNHTDRHPIRTHPGLVNHSQNQSASSGPSIDSNATVNAGKFSLKFKRSSSILRQTRQTLEKEHHPSGSSPPSPKDQVQVELYGHISNPDSSPLLPEPVTAPTSPILEATSSPSSPRLSSSTPSHPSTSPRTSHPYGVWLPGQEPTSLPPPPRSPSGSAGRKRAEQLRKASSAFISDLDLDNPPSNRQPVTTRASRSASVDASNYNNHGSSKHSRWNSSASSRNWDLAEHFSSFGERLDQGKRSSWIKGKDKESDSGAFGNSNRNRNRSSASANSASANPTKESSISTNSNRRLSAFFSRRKRPQQPPVDQSHSRHPTSSSESSTQRRFSSIISSVQTSRASILVDKSSNRTLSSFFRNPQAPSDSGPTHSSRVQSSSSNSTATGQQGSRAGPHRLSTRRSALTSSPPQSTIVEGERIAVSKPSSRISRTFSKLVTRSSRILQPRADQDQPPEPATEASVANTKPPRLENKDDGDSFILVDLDPQEKAQVNPPQSPITPTTASSSTPRATRFSDPGSNAHLRATAQKQQEQETAKRRPRPHTEPCGQNCSDREGSGSAESSHSFGRTTQVISERVPPRTTSVNTTNRMSSMSTSTSSASRAASSSQSSSGRSPSAGIGGSLFSNNPTSRPRRGSAAASTATTVSNQRGATPSSQRGGATSVLPRSIRSADGDTGKPFGISFAEAESRPTTSSRTSIINHTHSMNNSTSLEETRNSTGPNISNPTPGAPGSRRTAISLLSKDPRFPEQNERKRTESESRGTSGRAATAETISVDNNAPPTPAAASPRGGTFASLRRLMRKPSARRSKSGNFSSIPAPSNSKGPASTSRGPSEVVAGEFDDLGPLTPKRENASLPAVSPAKSNHGVEKSPSRSSRILSPFRARENPLDTPKSKTNGKGKQKPKAGGNQSVGNDDERERNGIADAFDDEIWQRDGLERREMESEETDTETELPHLWENSRNGDPEGRIGLGEGPLRQRNENGENPQDPIPSSIRSGGSSSSSRNLLGSLRSGGDRSLTLQALSPTTTRLGQGLASPTYRSANSTPTKGRDFSQERRGSLASGLSEEAGMGVALTLGQDSTSQLDLTRSRSRPSTGAASPQNSSIPSIWRGSGSGGASSMARVLSAPAHSAPSQTFQLADESGVLDPETEYGHPHSRFASTAENSVSGSSFVTAPSSDTPSSAKVPLPELDSRIEFPMISDLSLEDGKDGRARKRSQPRNTTSLDLPSQEDARAGTASPLSSLMVSLDQMQKSSSNSLSQVGPTASPQDRRLEPLPSGAYDPSTPSRGARHSLGSLPATSGKDSLSATPALTTISSLSPSSPPSALQRKRHTFGGSEAGGSGDHQHWRNELRDISLPRSGFSSTRSHAHESSRSVDLSEIESNVAAVEQALHQHSVSGSFDPSSVRRRFISSDAHGAANSSSSAPYNSIVSSPDDQAPSMIHQSSPSRLVLPPGSQKEIEEAVTQVRRAISSSQLQRERDESERRGQSSVSHNDSEEKSPHNQVQTANAGDVSARESTPARAARVRGVSMREVEVAYKSMTELVTAVAGLTPSPAVDREAFVSPNDSQPHRRSTQAAPPPRQLFDLVSEDSRERERTRSAGAISMPSRPSKVTQPRFRHGYSRSGSGVPSVASLMGMPASHSVDASNHLRGRSSSTSMGSKRAASESPARPQRDADQQHDELAKQLQFALRAASRPSENDERRRSPSPSPPPAPLAQPLSYSTVQAPHQQVSRQQPNGKRHSGETGGSGHSRSMSGGAGGTSPSATAKTQGTPRSMGTDRANLRNSSEWGTEDHVTLEQPHRRTGSRVSEADVARVRRQSMGMEHSTSGFEARPLTLNNNSHPRRTSIIDERFGSRSHFIGPSLSMRSANARRSPTPLAPYRESNSMQDWASATALAPRPVSRSSAGGAGVAHSFGAASSRFSKRQSMGGGYDSARSHTMGHDHSEADSIVSEAQRRHELERDSLLDSLEKLRQSRDDVQSQLHAEVTRTLELSREIQRRDAREAQYQEQQAEYESRIQDLLSRLEDSASERHQLMEEVQSLRNQLARKALDNREQERREMGQSSELEYPSRPGAYSPRQSLTADESSPQRGPLTQPLTHRALGSSSPASRDSGAGASSRANASTRPGSAGGSSHNFQSYPSALGFQAQEPESGWNVEDERFPQGRRRRESSSEEESDLGGVVVSKYKTDLDPPRKSLDEVDLMSEPLPDMRGVLDDDDEDDQGGVTGSIPDEEESETNPTPPPSRIPTSISASSSNPGGNFGMLPSGSTKSTLGGKRRIPTSQPSNSRSRIASAGSPSSQRFSYSGIPQSSRVLSGATTAADSSFTAESDSPMGSYISRHNGREGYWSEKRPKGYSATQMPEHLQKMLDD